jgi:hypothetical protein
MEHFLTDIKPKRTVPTINCGTVLICFLSWCAIADVKITFSDDDLEQTNKEIRELLNIASEQD